MLSRKKERDFRLWSLEWRKIPRANNPEKGLSSTAVQVLAEGVCRIKESGRAIFTHDELSEITNCERHQNTRILKQLDNILDIKFHRSIAINNKREFNIFVINLLPQGERQLKLTKDFYRELGIPYPSRSKNNIVNFKLPKKKKEHETFH